MPTNAAIGYQMTFGIWNGTSYVNVAEVIAITPPQLTRDAVDASHQQSPNGWKEYINGWKDGGEPSVTVNYVPSATDPLLAAFNSSTVGQYRITHPNGVTCTFTAVIKGFSPETPIDDRMRVTLDFQVSGQPVWA